MALFKLGKMTLGSLFKKPETILYPLETKPAPAGLKGHIEIVAQDCILCGMCERSCPTSCLAVDKAARTWSINRYACIQCGYCTTVCPKKCLAMMPGYAAAATAVVRDLVEVPVTEKPAKKVDTAGKSPAKAESASPADAPAKAPAPEMETPSNDGMQDAVLEAKIALLDAESAEKVRAALKR